MSAWDDLVVVLADSLKSPKVPTFKCGCPRTPENTRTYWHEGKPHHRCLECHRARNRDYMEAKRK